MDMILTDESPSQISDTIKSKLYLQSLPNELMPFDQM